jgi:hypothetical protein
VFFFLSGSHTSLILLIQQYAYMPFTYFLFTPTISLSNRTKAKANLTLLNLPNLTTAHLWLKVH